MIRINLAPEAEVADRTWFIGDLSLYALAAVVFLGVTATVRSRMSEVITTLEAQAAQKRSELVRLGPRVKRYEKLLVEQQVLDARIASIRHITQNQVNRYKPIIIIEQLQRLLPERAWLTSLSTSLNAEYVRVVGGAQSPEIISDFVTALNTTKFQEVDPVDLRTQVYYSRAYIARIGVGPRFDSGASATSHVFVNAPLERVKRFQTLVADPRAAADAFLEPPRDASTKLFPEWKEAPSFDLYLETAVGQPGQGPSFDDTTRGDLP